MKRLRSVLAPYSKEISLGGSGPNAMSVEQLKLELREVSRSNEHYFAICVVMILVLFLASLWVIMRFLGRPDVVTTAFAALGISTAGLLRAMIRLWREKVATDMLLALAGALTKDALKSVIAVLLKRLN